MEPHELWTASIIGTTELGIHTAEEAASFLRTRFGAGIGEVTRLGQGAWSTAYAFRHDGHDYIARFGKHVDDFERDQIAVSYATPDLPIPKVIEIGEAAGAYYAVSERAFGGFIDRVDGAQMRALLPSLFAGLDAARNADLSGTRGYGGWGADRNGTSPTWRDELLGVAIDRPEFRGHGWRQKMVDSAIGAGMFDEAFAYLEIIVDCAPTDRHLIHGDLLNFNVLVADNRLSAVFDWGCSRYGDFLYDIAWFAFWAPWYPEWEGIDFAQEALRHHAEIGLEVPGFAERLRCCQIHIGLDNQAYCASIGRWDQFEEIGRRTLAVVRGESFSRM